MSKQKSKKKEQGLKEGERELRPSSKSTGHTFSSRWIERLEFAQFAWEWWPDHSSGGLTAFVDFIHSATR